MKYSPLVCLHISDVLKSIRETHDNGKWKTKLLVRDTIADITLQQIMTLTKEFDVIVTMTLNGAFVSDAFAAQVFDILLSIGLIACPKML